jgi:hypothetical protein
MAKTLQPAKNVVIGDGVTADDLMLQYGAIQGEIAGRFTYRDLVNTNYLTEPVKGGTVEVARLAMANSQDYGTARTAGSGNKIENNSADIKIDKDQEFAEEMNAKDLRLWNKLGDVAVLENRRSSFALSMGIELENAYYTKLQQTAVAAGLVDLSSASDIQDKLSLLIQTLEAVKNNNVDRVDRELMVLTLASKWYDSLEKVLTTLENPISGRTDAVAFRGVEVRRATRQGFDAIIQVIGSIAQPVVFDEFYVAKPELSNDKYAYMSYYYGTGAVMGDLVFAGALDTDISA